MDHSVYMKRCLQLALNGLGTAAPNPLVGSVIVYKDTIIGEGWHYQPGSSHAEVNAIHSVSDPSLLQYSTIYVNLEPCAHFGRTPPCADLIAEKKIPRVVIGCRDPFAEVSGKGIQKLKKSGIEVIENVMEEECLEINRRFFTFHRKKRPYITLKWAQSLDGFIDKEREDGETGPNWITGKATKMLVHQWRAQEDAILIGRTTAVNDNPLLTVREVAGRNPVRLLIDPQLKVPADMNIFNGDSRTVVFNYHRDSQEGAVCYSQVNSSSDILPQILEYCYSEQLLSVIVEGGAQTLQHFIDQKLWDEARIFIGQKVFHAGVRAPKIPSSPLFHSGKTGNDQLLIFRNV